MPNWGELFLPTTPLLELVVRGTLTFLALYAVMRVAGKREGGVHSLTDLLVVVLVGSLAANGMIGEADGVADSVILIGTVLAWSVALDAAAYRWPWVSRLLKARATPLIVDGRIDRHALHREYMQVDELMAELRLHGITDVREVSRAYLEANGMVSVIRADRAEPDEVPLPRASG